MSTVVSKNVQIGADGTASNNFTAYQPAAPDGTLRIGNGNSGSVTDAITLTSAGNLGLGVTPSAWGGSYKAFQFSSSVLLLCEREHWNKAFMANNFYSDGGTFRYYKRHNRGAQLFGLNPNGAGGYALVHRPLRHSR
jgi:hypothetical protein